MYSEKKTRNDSTVLRNAYINMVTEINIFQSYESEALTRIIVCNVSLWKKINLKIKYRTYVEHVVGFFVGDRMRYMTVLQYDTS